MAVDVGKSFIVYYYYINVRKMIDLLILEVLLDLTSLNGDLLSLIIEHSKPKPKKKGKNNDTIFYIIQLTVLNFHTIIYNLNMPHVIIIIIIIFRCWDPCEKNKPKESRQLNPTMRVVLLRDPHPFVIFNYDIWHLYFTCCNLDSGKLRKKRDTNSYIIILFFTLYTMTSQLPNMWATQF